MNSKLRSLTSSSGKSLPETSSQQVEQPPVPSDLALIEKNPEGEFRFTAAGNNFLRKASGCNSVNLGHRFLIQALKVVGRDEAKGDLLGQVEVASAFLASVGPAADAIEGALATQLLGLHATAMRCLAEAVKATDSRCVDLYLNRVAKLLRTFSQQSEALNRHRGRGQQTVRVEHVHVNAGGQAIVGAVNAGGGGKHEK
jgi:hypothetical protein